MRIMEDGWIPESAVNNADRWLALSGFQPKTDGVPERMAVGVMMMLSPSCTALVQPRRLPPYCTAMAVPGVKVTSCDMSVVVTVPLAVPGAVPLSLPLLTTSYHLKRLFNLGMGLQRACKFTELPEGGRPIRPAAASASRALENHALARSRLRHPVGAS
jgi:hypothetical protein